MIPERQTGGLRKPHTAGGSARPRGPRGRAVAWGTATAGPWPVPGTSRSRRREPTVLPAWGETGVERKTSDEPACPSQSPPGTAGPPRRLLTAPVLPGRLLPARPRASSPPRSRVSLAAATPAPRATPAGARYSLRKRATQRRLLLRLGLGGGRAQGTWLRAAKAPDPPPTRFQKAAYPHTRLRGSARAREPRPAPAAEDAWAAGTV